MLAYTGIQRDYSAKCGPFQLGAVFVQMCVSWINFKVVREVGWVPTPACAHQKAWGTWCDVLPDTTRGDLGMECLQSQKTHSLCLLYFSGFLLFCIATWLSGTVLFRFYTQASDWVWTLGSPACRLLCVLRTTACGAAQDQSSSLEKLTGCFTEGGENSEHSLWGKSDWSFSAENLPWKLHRAQ